MAETRISPAPLALRERILDAARETLAEHRGRQPYAFPDDFFDVRIAPAIRQAFTSKTGGELAESSRILVAEVGDEFAGYLQLACAPEAGTAAAGYLHIDDIYVVPRYRGEGVGLALLDHIKRRAEADDLDNITATVWAANAASDALFRRAGFEPSSTTFRFGPDRQARPYRCWILDAPPPVPPTRRPWVMFAAGVILALVASRVLG